jgi:butyrate response factor 1
MVQLVLDIYRSISTSLYVRTKDGKPVGLDARELKRLARRTVGNTLKGIASLLLASLGAGLGTVLIRPSTGTWIGMFASTSILHKCKVIPWLILY